MSERKEPQPKHMRRRGRGIGLIAIGSASALVGIVGYAIAPYSTPQTPDGDTPSPAPMTAEPFPTVEITPTETPTSPEPTVATLTPEPAAPAAPSPSPTNTLGYGRGEKPATFSWTLPDGTTFQAKSVETIPSVQDVPDGHFNAAWVGDYAGACASEGTVWMDGHSSLEKGNALMPPDLMKQLGQKGLGIIHLTTKNGLSCDYEVQWAKSVVKFGSEPGTFADFVTGNNPLRHDLRDQKNINPGIVFVSCDQTQGFNGQVGTSNNNGIIYGKLVGATKK